MRYLSLGQLLDMYLRIMEETGGAAGVRDWIGLRSALAQPRVTFRGKDLYPTTVEKAAALGFSLIMNHPFLDGNKRVGHAAMEVFLLLNGLELQADVDEQERVILSVAASELGRQELTSWLCSHVRPQAAESPGKLEK